MNFCPELSLGSAFLPQSSSQVSSTTIRLTPPIQSNCKALLVLSLKYIVDLRTSVSPRPWSQSPKSPSYHQSPLVASSVSTVPFVPSYNLFSIEAFYKSIHRQMLSLSSAFFTTLFPSPSTVPRTLEGAQQIIKK